MRRKRAIPLRRAGKAFSPHKNIGWLWTPSVRLAARAVLFLVLFALLLLLGGLVLTRLAGQRQPSSVAGVPTLAPAVPWTPSPSPFLTPTASAADAPAATASPVPTAATIDLPSDPELQFQVAQMSLPAKIGQMMMAGFQGQSLAASPDLSTLISTYHVGGLVLLEANAHDPRQIAQLLGEAQQLALQQDARVPLFAAINHEGGIVVRITEGVTGFPGNMAVAATGRPEYAMVAAAMAAQELRAMGFNMNLAPVLDVNDNPLNPVIGVRSFGASPAQVAELGLDTIRGFQQNGVIAVAKHFPGHGSTAVDSHVGLPVIDKPISLMEQVELFPFQVAVSEGVEAVMSAHIVAPALDPTPGLPSSLSTAVLTGILRERMGFDGIIMSDALGMGAIVNGWGQAQAAVKAVQAGTDIVISTGPLEAQIAILQALIAAVQQGEIPQSQIDASVLRILRVKHKYGLWDQEPGDDLSAVGSPAHQAAADEIALAALTLLRDDAHLVPLPPGTRRLLILSPDALPPASGGEETLLAQILREQGFEITELVFSLDSPTSRQTTYAQAMQAAPDHDVILFGEWELVKRAVNQSDRWQETLIAALQQSGKPLMMIAWHHPGAILRTPQVESFLVTYGNTPAQVRAVAQILTGQAAPQGRLPLAISVP